MFQRNILAGIFILIFFAPFAYAGKVELTTYYPSPYAEYLNLKSTADSYFASSAGGVGVGLTMGTLTAGIKLEVAQNEAIKLGQAYLSSGGNYAHLANNEFYNGSSWVGSAPGILFQLNGATNAIVYGQSGGTHTAWATVSSTAGWAAGCTQALKQNIHTLTFADYALLRKEFRATDLFSYNRRDIPTEPEVGFIAEHAPDLVLDKTKTGVPLIKGIGYLAAILKAQENVLMPLEKEVQALKDKIRAFRMRQQQQIEALQKDVEGLRKEFHGLKGEVRVY
ncbi:MAG: hypothetical protein ABH891_08850 [Candidatus Omnitrophota bacterium]